MFSWDPRKAILNVQKHGVPFEEAATVFADADGLEWEDPVHSEGELSYTLRRGPDGKETVRIIGARQASRKERQAYARPSP
jgi:uncharacterized DUF497 family protein